jgi:hypothetical protein
MPFKPLKLNFEQAEKKEKREEARKTEQPKETIQPSTPTPLQAGGVAKLSEAKDPSGWKRFILEGDPLNVVDIEKYFTEDKVVSGIATAQYDNTVVAASAGYSFEVSLIDVWNNSDSDRTIGFRFGTGTLRFQKKIAPKTGFPINLVKTKWRGPTNTAFNIYCYDPSPNVSFTIFGELV